MRITVLIHPMRIHRAKIKTLIRTAQTPDPMLLTAKTAAEEQMPMTSPTGIRNGGQTTDRAE